MRRFNNKIIIITGADSELGHATAMRLAREGAIIILIGMDDKKLSATADELPEDHTWINAGNHLSVTSDITNHDQAKKLVDYVVDRYQHIDGVININTKFTMEAPLVSELSQTQGNIVDVYALPNSEKEWSLPNYYELIQKVEKDIAKYAHQYASQSIRINAVVVGAIKGSIDADKLSEFTQQSPLAQPIELEDAVESITFLADEDNRQLTGVTLPVDGGLSLKRQSDY